VDRSPLVLVLTLWTLGAPAALFVFYAAAALLRRRPSEALVAATARWAFLSAVLSSLALFATLFVGGLDRVVLSLGTWFAVEEHGFELALVVDRLSLPFTFLTATLCGVIGAFAGRYLHREPGFHRFFVLLALFAAGMQLLVLAGSIDVLFAGWELVGISSALLIGFFHERRAPVRNALRAFTTYRVCDVGLLSAAMLTHHALGTSGFAALYGPAPWPGGAPALEGGLALAVGLLLLLAVMGKSALVPFSGWLPRAMEGPTPSSAIFYGALSVHAGPYLLLRNGPLFEAVPLAAAAVVAVGAVTALHATLVGRAQTDIKSALAYASLTQLGLILVEIGLGLRLLALAHIVGHALVRALQLLRAPSLLHEHHRLESAVGGHLPHTGAHLERLLPERARRWLYRLALERGYHDGLLTELVVDPVLRLLGWIDRLERRWIARLGGAPAAAGAPAPAATGEGGAAMDLAVDPAGIHPAGIHPAGVDPAAPHPAAADPAVGHPAVADPAAADPAVGHPARVGPRPSGPQGGAR